jgi:hypothetical protein
LLLILLAAIQTTVLAQDARTLLNNAAKALGTDHLKTLHYSGSGSSYVVTQGPLPAGGWAHGIMKSYVRDLNLDAMTSRLQLVRSQGTPSADQTLSHAIDANSSWSSQYEFWITPYGFLKGAIANNATVEPKTVFGTVYRAVMFTLPGNHKVVGYINDKNIVERVETWIGDKNDVLIEAQYSDYKDFNGVKVPMMIMQKQEGSLSLILIVNDVKVGS